MALGTYCKYRDDVCNMTGSLPDERRAALELLDVRESLGQFCAVIHWVPTDHMLAYSLTRRVPTDIMTNYLRDMTYYLTCEQYHNDTKRALAKVSTSLS